MFGRKEIEKMSVEQLCGVLLAIIKKNGLNDFIRMRCFSNTNANTTIVSIIQDDEEPPGNATKQSDGCWTGFLEENVQDFKVYGVAVFRGYCLAYLTILTAITIQFLEFVYFGRGLKCHCMEHQGSFFMNGYKQSNMASASMSESPGNTSNHNYSSIFQQHKLSSTA